MHFPIFKFLINNASFELPVILFTNYNHIIYSFTVFIFIFFIKKVLQSCLQHFFIWNLYIYMYPQSFYLFQNFLYYFHCFFQDKVPPYQNSTIYSFYLQFVLCFLVTLLIFNLVFINTKGRGSTMFL